MKAAITFDFGKGKTSFTFGFDYMKVLDGKLIEFENVKDPAGNPENRCITLEEVISDNGLERKFCYNKNLFGDSFAQVMAKDINTLIVEEGNV